MHIVSFTCTNFEKDYHTTLVSKLSQTFLKIVWYHSFISEYSHILQTRLLWSPNSHRKLYTFSKCFGACLAKIRNYSSFTVKSVPTIYMYLLPKSLRMVASFHTFLAPLSPVFCAFFTFPLCMWFDCNLDSEWTHNVSKIVSWILNYFHFEIARYSREYREKYIWIIFDPQTIRTKFEIFANIKQYFVQIKEHFENIKEYFEIILRIIWEI